MMTLRSRARLLFAIVLLAGAASAHATNFELFDVIRINPGTAVEGSCATPCFRVILTVVIRLKSGSTASMSPTIVIEPSKPNPMADVDRDFGTYAAAARNAIADSLANHGSDLPPAKQAVATAFAKKLQSDLGFHLPPAITLSIDEQLVLAAIAHTAAIGTELKIAGAGGGVVDIDVPSLTAAQIQALRGAAANIPGVATSVPSAATLRMTTTPVTLTIWVAAFIPGSLASVTETMNAGPNAGKSVVRLLDPVLQTCISAFLTDQRAFSNSFAETQSRIRGDAVLNLTVPRLTFAGTAQQTTGMDCTTGAVTCMKTADASGLVASGFRSEVTAEGGSRYFFTLSGGASNPCVAGAPSIVWKLPFVVLFTAADGTIRISLDGLLKTFPAYEAYARIGSGTRVTLFQVNPAAGVGPEALLLPPSKVVQVIGQIVP